MKKRNVEEDALIEIIKSFSLYERIVIKIFHKEFIKIYNIIRIKLMNMFLN